MSEGWHGMKWLGPLGTPVAVFISLIGLIVTFQSQATTVGWRVFSVLAFFVSLVWSIWYLRAMTTRESLGLTRKVRLHDNKWWRSVAFLLPVLTAVLCALAFLPQREDYSSLLQGGGPYSPMVVFDSKPRGAMVRVAKSYYADDDPLLENKDDNHIFRLPEPTLTRTRLWQGHYWVVFELKWQN